MVRSRADGSSVAGALCRCATQMTPVSWSVSLRHSIPPVILRVIFFAAVFSKNLHACDVAGGCRVAHRAQGGHRPHRASLFGQAVDWCGGCGGQAHASAPLRNVLRLRIFAGFEERPSSGSAEDFFRCLAQSQVVGCPNGIGSPSDSVPGTE